MTVNNQEFPFFLFIISYILGTLIFLFRWQKPKSMHSFINFQPPLTNNSTSLNPHEMSCFRFQQSSPPSHLPSPTASQLTHQKSRLTPSSLTLMRKIQRCRELNCLGRWDHISSFSSLLSNVCCILLHVFTLTIIWEKVSKKILMEDKHDRSENSLWVGREGL